MTAAPHLRVVDTETGEVHGSCPMCAQVQAELEETTRKLRGAWLQIRKLERDVEQDQRDHALHGKARELFAEWKRLCRHPRAKFDYGTGSRCERLLWALKTYEWDHCMKVLAGAAYDPWTGEAKNGHVERYDDVCTIFKNARNVERMANRAPRKGAA